jgi:hypothetical protein
VRQQQFEKVGLVILNKRKNFVPFLVKISSRVKLTIPTRASTRKCGSSKSVSIMSGNWKRKWNGLEKGSLNPLFSFIAHGCRSNVANRKTRMKPFSPKSNKGGGASVVILLLLISMRTGGTVSTQDIFPVIEVKSALVADSKVPLHWVEVMIFPKDPASAESFERPIFDESFGRKIDPATGTVEVRNKLPMKLKLSAFPALKLWVLYRIGDLADEPATFESPELRALRDKFREKAWVFELPLSASLSQISINADSLMYSLDNGNVTRVAGSAFSGSYFPYKSFKGGETSFTRVDRLTSAQQYLESLNRDLPPTMQLDLGNNRSWDVQIALHLGRNSGPSQRDKLVMEQGYTPIFVVFHDSAIDVDLARDPWFVAPKATKKVIYTNLGKEDPVLWAKLPTEVRRRYQNPSKIKVGGDDTLIVFWKGEGSESHLPDVLFIYGRATTGDDLRTIVFRLAPATAD